MHPTKSRADHPTMSIADSTATSGLPEDSVATNAHTESPQRYVLNEEIARGGMGAVYRATDTAFGREVAVKVLLDKFAPNSPTARRFHDEARITGQLQHPGIPPVFDLGTLSDGRPFLAMKLIKGETLDELLSGQPDRGRLLAAFEAVCHAVAYAHAHGVIHRDLKPSNVMVGAFGEVQVMDWGLAKVLGPGTDDELAGDPEATTASTRVESMRDSEELLTQAGSVLGTPAYMAPEQAVGALHEVDRRSDVFGLGGILAAILTGKPPFIGNSGEISRVMAARGQVDDCFSRLDECGVDPELVALAKHCLAPGRKDRPADATEVAMSVAALRAAADERARQAELDRVKAEGDVAAAEAASVERRKRRRLWFGAAAALVVAVVSGLGAVLAVQRRANTELAAANSELAVKNIDLEAERAKVEQRFEMARKAIAAFHTTIDEQPELGNEVFRPLRKKLLESAAGFYRELEGLLAKESDAKSRSALADGYVQLAELTEKIGELPEAIAMGQKALAIRRELAKEPGADTQVRLAMAAALHLLGKKLAVTGDSEGALEAYQESLKVAEALMVESPSDAARVAIANGYQAIGSLLLNSGQPTEVMEDLQKALEIRKQLAESQPTVAQHQSDLANVYSYIAVLLQVRMNKSNEALAKFRETLEIRQKLADANPEVPEIQYKLALGQYNLGVMLDRMDQPAEALAAHQRACEINQKLAKDYPAVTRYQRELASSHMSIGWELGRLGKRQEALAEGVLARDLLQKLADAHPTATDLRNDLAQSNYNLGNNLQKLGDLNEALSAYLRSQDVRQKLADTNPADTEYQSDLAESHDAIGSLLVRLGKPSEALVAYQKAQTVWQTLVDAYPADNRFRVPLAETRQELGRLLAREGRFEEALAAIDSALIINQNLLDASPNDPEYESSLGYSHSYRGWTRMRTGERKSAAEDLRTAVRLWRKDPKLSAETRFEQARALALLAKLGESSDAGVTGEEVKLFSDQSIAALGEALKAGWDPRSELLDSDFESVRNREDFQKLQEQILQPAGLGS